MKRQNQTYAQQVALRRIGEYLCKMVQWELDNPHPFFAMISDKDFVGAMDRDIKECMDRVERRNIAEQYACSCVDDPGSGV